MVNGNITQLSDMQIPENWGAYLAEKSTQNNAFFTSGVVQNVPQIAALLGAGKVANMPLFKPLADDDPQVPDDTTDLLVNKITTDLAPLPDPLDASRPFQVQVARRIKTWQL
ncbi:hypothetical protein [Lactiplantibacillus plantarum]|uniref:hypothetical protein n=1 Tax=Lactiplantibacillus plantarum TaxID=1590 RepID=UPI00215D97B7|nr:hypothetical protein [Lactiplantibacillus plantarum]